MVNILQVKVSKFEFTWLLILVSIATNQLVALQLSYCWISFSWNCVGVTQYTIRTILLRLDFSRWALHSPLHGILWYHYFFSLLKQWWHIEFYWFNHWVSINTSSIIICFPVLYSFYLIFYFSVTTFKLGIKRKWYSEHYNINHFKSEENCYLSPLFY